MKRGNEKKWSWMQWSRSEEPKKSTKRNKIRLRNNGSLKSKDKKSLLKKKQKKGKNKKNFKYRLSGYWLNNRS